MTLLRMGSTPDDLVVELQSGAAYSCTATLDDALWEAGEGLELRFDTGDTWPAVVNVGASDASWWRSAADVAALIAKTPQGAALWYIAADGSPYKWAGGTAEVLP